MPHKMAVANTLLNWAQLTLRYEILLLQHIFFHLPYRQEGEDHGLFPDDKWARVQIFSLALIFKLWDKPHYRSQSFQVDMIDNLKNVAIPGTGIPLSVFCYSYWTCLFVVLVVNPIVCLLGAINKSRRVTYACWESRLQDIVNCYEDHLLHPDDWFSLWRMNCRLVSYHSLVTQAPDYRQEDKWTFLTSGKESGVPVTPYFEDLEVLVCKNKNIEGGMGIFFYKNAAHGGDWILQKKLSNAQWLNDLLPDNAPLSTMRVITTSTHSLLSLQTISGDNLDEGKDNRSEEFTPDFTYDEAEESSKFIRAESAVLRLGRKNASTDHSSVIFNVNTATGEIEDGTSNAHWYQLGLVKALQCPWLPTETAVKCHPDSPNPYVSGKTVPEMKEALVIVCRAHFRMMKNVPIVGWDVAFSNEGIFLLEVNLSCNFFKGRFDVDNYVDFLHQHWIALQILEEEQAKGSKKET